MKMFYCPKCDKLEINFKFKNLNEERELHTFSNIRDGWGMPINHIICRNCGNLLAGVMTLRENDKDEIELLDLKTKHCDIKHIYAFFEELIINNLYE